MIKVAILGFGIVGSGVAHVLTNNNKSLCKRAGTEIVLSKILDIREFENNPFQKYMIKNIDEILSDNEIKIVVETIGGSGIAYEFTKKSLEAGKNVVTSNKELVARKGPELLRTAAANKVRYLFEASVGGGIPIIRPLSMCLSANDILEITGILNGTTNYILTKMKEEDIKFEEALAMAKANGYAESDPSCDIDGYDPCRKIAILSSIAYGKFMDYNKVHTEGIRNICTEDMKIAENRGMVIKLIAHSKNKPDGVEAMVCPVMLPAVHQLANINDVFNAILVNGEYTGDVLFCGKGAGSLPTASAVAGDIIDIARNENFLTNIGWDENNQQNILPVTLYRTRYYVRLICDGAEAVKDNASKIFGGVNFMDTSFISSGDKECVAFITAEETEEFLRGGLEKLKGIGDIKNIDNVIRVIG